MSDPISQAGQIGSAATADVANWPFEQRLKVTLERARLGPEVRAQLQAVVSAEYSYVGTSFLTFVGGAASRMGGYGVGRLAAELSSHKWRLAAYLDNVADTRANTFAFGNPFNAAAQATPLRPRTFGLRIERMY